jgi:hypothetical protein
MHEDATIQRCELLNSASCIIRGLTLPVLVKSQPTKAQDRNADDPFHWTPIVVRADHILNHNIASNVIILAAW